MPINDELKAEIQDVVNLGMTEADSLPLLRELAQEHDEKLFRVRAAFRLLRDQAPEAQA